MPQRTAILLLAALFACGCANQTTFHTVPQGAQVYVNGAPCGDSPCVYHSRYGFPDRIHVELKKEGFASADFYLDSEPPMVSYLLLGFGSYLFHTFSEEYRFQLKPLPTVTKPEAAPESAPPKPEAPAAPPQEPSQPEKTPAPPGGYWI